MKIFDSFNEIKFFSWLIILTPLSLLTGPAIPDILLSIIASYFLIKTINLKLYNAYNNIFIKILIIFSIYLIFTAIISIDPIFSLLEYGVIFYFRYFLFILGFIYLINKNQELLRYFSKFSLIVILLVIVDGYFQFFFGKNILGFQSNYPGRLSGVFNSELILGIFLASFSPILIGLIIKIYNLNLRNKYILFFLLISFGLTFLSGERAALMHYLIFILIVSILSKSINFKFLVLTLATILIIFISLISISDHVNNRYKETLRDYQQTEYLLPFTLVHEGHLKSAAKMFIDKPIFGQGPKMFSKLCGKEEFYNKFSCTSHPHNFYLQLLAETGIIGAIFLIGLFLYFTFFFLKNFFYKYKNNLSKVDSDSKIIFIASLFSMIWPLAPTFDFFNNWYNVIIFINIALILNSFNIISFNESRNER